ncbi:uncharacterized protein LOC116288483 [Actinia tenebrosa]|uniref:Uncharacterized protein LOC116288483 n=1 Tax=Actinia tenebrosa TaxID=6105 RepID=A0A6P8H6M3_ACTTE|nr:uncharacterized protein LOC116288483 [Actinia tenebrosa]
MKLLPVFILLVVPFQSNADNTGGGPKSVYSCPGSDVDLKFNTPGPITRSHLVGTKGGGIDANPLNMSVWISNNFKTEVNATAGNKVEFNGNLFAGHAWFKFKNFKPNDRDMIFRISTYKEFGTSPSKQDFKLILSKDCAQQKNSSAGNSTSVSSNSTANLVPLPPEKTTPNSKGESYPDGTSPDNSILSLF